MRIGERRFAAALLVSCAACGGVGDASPAAVRRDSAGITIVENTAAGAERETGWRVDSIPDLDIGADPSDAQQQLFRVNGITQLEEGRVVVVNAGSQEVRFYDGARLVHSVGREGEGPGEFRFPMLVRGPEGDSLLILDLFANRVSVFGRDGTLGRTITSSARIGQPIGMLGNQRLLTSGSTARAGLDTPEGVVANSVVYELLDLATDARDTMIVVPGQTLFLGNRNGQISFTATPLQVPPGAAVGAAGVVLTPGDAHEVRYFDGDGVLRTIARVDRPVVPVTDAQFAGAIEAIVAPYASDANAAAELRRRYAQLSPPAASPVYVELIVDSEGSVWAREHAFDETAPSHWLVFDAGGEALGRVTTPAGLRIHEIGADYVLGVWRDALDVEHARRYTLHREPRR